MIDVSLRKKIIKHVEDKYHVKPDYPFEKYPKFAVFRHKENEKWFGLIMNVEKEKLGLDGEKEIDILDVKLEPEIVGSMKEKEGFLSAYHMNKEHWITAKLTGEVKFEEIKKLIEDSFHLTKGS